MKSEKGLYIRVSQEESLMIRRFALDNNLSTKRLILDSLAHYIAYKERYELPSDTAKKESKAGL